MKAKKRAACYLVRDISMSGTPFQEFGIVSVRKFYLYIILPVVSDKDAVKIRPGETRKRSVPGVCLHILDLQPGICSDNMNYTGLGCIQTNKQSFPEFARKWFSPSSREKSA